jgi:two-component system nitrate/nitrite response regulator NarL
MSADPLARSGPHGDEDAPPVTVIVADDNDYFRAGIVRALRNRNEFEVVRAVADGALAMEAIRELSPEIALLDARMPVLDGLSLTKLLTADPAFAATRVVVLSARVDAGIADEARDAGAAAFLDKTQPRRRICEAILTVAGRDPAAR